MLGPEAHLKELLPFVGMITLMGRITHQRLQQTLMVPVLNEVNVFKPHAADEPIIGHRLLDTGEFIEEFGCCALHPGIKGGGASHSYLDSV